MDVELARWLVGTDGVAELRAAAADPAPGSLAAAERLRERLSADQAAAVASQLALRERAKAKFGAQAATLFFTSVGLEQASRPRVSRWRAERFAAVGVRRVADLGCGLGADGLALRRLGLQVLPVEADPVTAVFAQANLGVPVEVGDAVEAEQSLPNDVAVFADPARRTGSGRSWRVEDLSPPWSFVESVLARRTACVKLGPGLPHALMPRESATTWVSDDGDLVEASLWSGRWPRSRQAVLLPSGATLERGPVGVQVSEPTPPPRPDQVLYEPDPAVIRAGLVDALADELGVARVQPGIAYLIGDELHATPFATAFAVVEVLDTSERVLRAWVQKQGVGTLEIKKRGIDLDPAVLRRRLKPSGRNAATLVLTPTSVGARALVVRRLKT